MFSIKAVTESLHRDYTGKSNKKALNNFVRLNQSEAPLTQDHVVCCNIGAPEAMHNVVWACQPCNSSKGSKDLPVWWDEVHGATIKAKDYLPRLPALSLAVRKNTQ